MKLFSAEQIRAIDQATIEQEPIESIDLVERAAAVCTNWITEHYENDLNFHIFCGMGNNGADGLAMARQLVNEGYEVEVFVIAHRSQGSPNFNQNINRLSEVQLDVSYVNDRRDMPQVEETSIAIDAILGIGLDKPLRGILKDVTNSIREGYDHVISIDVPTGLPSDLDMSIQPSSTVLASHTLTFQFPKLSFLVEESGKYCGEIHVLNIGLSEEAAHDIDSPYHLTTEFDAERMRKRRGTFTHKGTYGHALIVAGHEGMMGAAVLATRACMRSGAGLVTTHVPKSGRDVLQMAAPEAMVQVDHNEHRISNINLDDRFTAIGIGPGIGRESSSFDALKFVLQNAKVPLVLDADALHLLAHSGKWDLLPPNTILTPHPGEFKRMTGVDYTSSAKMLADASELATKYNCIIVLKGAFSAVCAPDGEVYFNGSGHPAMATAGSGDVLTGVITGLLAQGLKPLTAARFGTWIHGYAGESAAESRGEHAVIASDIIENLI